MFEVVEGMKGVFSLSGFTHAGYSAAVENTKAVLGRAGQWHVYGASEGGVVWGRGDVRCALFVQRVRN